MGDRQQLLHPKCGPPLAGLSSPYPTPAVREQKMGETKSELESKDPWVPLCYLSPDLMTYSFKA